MLGLDLIWRVCGFRFLQILLRLCMVCTCIASARLMNCLNIFRRNHRGDMCVSGLHPARHPSTKFRKTFSSGCIQSIHQSTYIDTSSFLLIYTQPIQSIQQYPLLRGKEPVPPTLLDVLPDLLLQLDGICTDDLIDLFAVLENQERGHGADAVFLSEFRELVDVDFEVMCIGIPFREFHDPGCNSLLVSSVQNRRPS